MPIIPATWEEIGLRFEVSLGKKSTRCCLKQKKLGLVVNVCNPSYKERIR
jgi:hypothetical protein